MTKVLIENILSESKVYNADYFYHCFYKMFGVELSVAEILANLYSMTEKNDYSVEFRVFLENFVTYIEDNFQIQ